MCGTTNKFAYMDIWVILKLVGSLALLMYGMKALSEELQKMAGPQMRQWLQRATSNRFMGMLMGMIVTAAIQSSTATTLMTVSFVNAGLFTLGQAISVILGAHIGTTLTAWIMSAGLAGGAMGGIAQYVYIAFFVGIILIYMKKRKSFGDFLFGAGFLFLGLGTLKSTGMEMHLEENPQIADFFLQFTNGSIPYPLTILIFLLIGTVLTLCVQSSAAIMAVTMAVCITGIMPVELGVLIVLGENIGTTITSNIAALQANVSARRTAFSHFMINTVGVVWMIFLLKPFLSMVYAITGTETNALLVLPTFHTLFNLINTLIMIWFVPQIEQIVCKVIKPKKEAEDEDARLSFISAGLMQTPELSILNAKKEIMVFGERCQRMFGFVRTLLHEEKEEEFKKLFSRIEKYESITDNMEVEIAAYLNQVVDGRLSIESKTEIQRMLRVVSEMESIGDACYNLARTINRQHAYTAENFTEKQYEHISSMLDLDDDALSQMNVIIKYGEQRYVDVNKSYNIEHEINNYRTQLKNQNVIDVNNQLYGYQIGIYYMDLISECEKLGDYVINVIEASGIKEKKAHGF